MKNHANTDKYGIKFDSSKKNKQTTNLQQIINENYTIFIESPKCHNISPHKKSTKQLNLIADNSS